MIKNDLSLEDGRVRITTVNLNFCNFLLNLTGFENHLKSFALNIQSSFSAPNYLEENINIFKWLKSLSILGEVIFLILSWGLNRRAFKICRLFIKTLYDSLNQMQKSREFADFYKI